MSTAATPTRTGMQDRRGFDWLLKFSLGMMAVNVVVLFLYSWKLGLAGCLFWAICFITTEAVSAPPFNNPRHFGNWHRRQDRRMPVMVCLGDSLTHGTISSSITPEIPAKLCEALGMNPPDERKPFIDPLWVVNCGQNGITSHTILRERMNRALGCYPDYILLWIGTNDALAMYNKTMSRIVTKMNELPEEPSLQNFERNFKGILDFIQQASPTARLGVCTLPPLGEDLTSPANQIVRQCNEIIERAAQGYGERCALIPVFTRLETILEKKRGRSSVPPEYAIPVAAVMNTLGHNCPSLFTWNRLAAAVGHAVLTDGIHLNDTGRDEVVEQIIDWLTKNNIAKAIAVKQ